MKRVSVLIFALAAALSGCDQFPIFYRVSQEVKPKDERIPGSPSKIVAAGDRLFVNNGKIWEASGANWTWNEIDHLPSGGRILDIATVASAGGGWGLFALSGDESSATIWVTDLGGSIQWSQVRTGKYQAIYGANDLLFAAVMRGGDPQSDSRNFDVEAIGSTGAVTVWTQTHFLSGVVYADDNYYAATNGSGIQYGDGTGPGTAIAMDDNNVVGIIEYVPGKIAAVTNSSKTAGRIYEIDASSNTVVRKTEVLSLSFTGALGVWEQAQRGKVLLAGVRITNMRFGYHEMTIKEDDSLSMVLNYPGKNAPTSISSDDYTATIETRAINSIIQAPGQSAAEWPLMFASTQAHGLWSYRYDSDEKRCVWNAED